MKLSLIALMLLSSAVMAESFGKRPLSSLDSLNHLNLSPYMYELNIVVHTAISQRHSRMSFLTLSKCQRVRDLYENSSHGIVTVPVDCEQGELTYDELKARLALAK